MERTGGKYRFKYRCCTTQLQCKKKQYKTPFDSDGNGNTVYLDRQNVDCKEQYLNSFQLQRDGRGKKVQYKYTCCEMPEEKTCISKATTMNNDGGGNAIYLDRHIVQCGDDQSLSQFKLVRGGNNKKYQYQYTCCHTNPPTGTTSMPSTTETTTTVPTTLEFTTPSIGQSTGSNQGKLSIFYLLKFGC